MDRRKIQELRAAVLIDLREFVPKNHYRFVRTDEDIAYRDIALADRLHLEQHYTPQFSPRQLTAVWLLQKIGLYCHKYESADPEADAAEGITPEIIKEMSLEHLHDALRRYISYLGADEAKALMPAGVPAAKVEASNETDNLTPTNNWKLKIQAEATRQWKKLVKMGCSPTRHSIKDDLAKWCRDNKVTTDGDIYPNANYIYKHVLRKAIWKSPTD